MEFEISSTILSKNDVENSGKRALFKAMGITDFELEGRPIIGIANAWNEVCPGHRNLREIAEYVKKGIYSNGGTAFEFGVTGSCDGVVDGDLNNAYILPHRDVIADAIEIQSRTSKFDGIVLLGSCDKIVPGMLMAAARINIPAIFINGGPMLGGIHFNGKKADQATTDEAVQYLKEGKITEDEFWNLEKAFCPTVGSCAYLGTANTMGCLAEAMGMSLPGCALIPAVYGDRFSYAFETGRKICDLVRDNIKARDIITNEAISNAVRVDQAICGSTNSIMHLTAIAKTAELSINVPDEYSRTYYDIPQIAKVNPASVWDMEDFYKAGGIPRVIKNLGKLLHQTALTCTGKTVKDNIDDYMFTYPENAEIIRTSEKPFQKVGSLSILTGNLAPNTAVTKPGAYDKSLYLFEGPARVFNSETEANIAILSNKINDGDVVVIRYEGPKGGPGMREMYRPMKYLCVTGQATTTALITDGRFSGANSGCFVGHISPEAAEGGPIAAVEDGDIIRIDVAAGKLEVILPEEIINNRLKNWKKPEKNVSKGYLRVYRKLAASAADGAMIDIDSL